MRNVFESFQGPKPSSEKKIYYTLSLYIVQAVIEPARPLELLDFTSVSFILPELICFYLCGNVAKAGRKCYGSKLCRLFRTSKKNRDHSWVCKKLISENLVTEVYDWLYEILKKNFKLMNNLATVLKNEPKFKICEIIKKKFKRKCEY